MNLAYLVNRPKINIKKTSYAAGIVTADHEPINVEGFNSLSLTLTGSGLRTFNLILEGRVSSVGNWIQLPVFNSNSIQQPYINIVDTYVTASGDILNTYFAEIKGYSEIRTRMEYTAGVGLTIGMTISEAELSLKTIGVARNVQANTSILTRDIEYVGRKYKAADAGVDPALLRPIWIKGANWAEVILTNNLNKTITLSNIMMYSDINSPLSISSFVYPIDASILPSGKLSITSAEYPQILNYGGIAFEIRQIGKSVGDASAGNYNLKLNFRK